MSEKKTKSILAIGAHPDDVEFGCGGILCREAERGSRIHLLVCSRGESGSNGSAEERVKESEAAARLLGASLQFLELGGDGRIENARRCSVAVARCVRELRPDVVLAPSLEENQHPDHAAVGQIARDAARLARYAGLAELKDLPPHAIESLCFYAITPGGEPLSRAKVVVDLGGSVERWRRLMECHATQMRTRRYLELQLARARALGLEIGGEYAQALWPSDPLVLGDLDQLPKGARQF